MKRVVLLSLAMAMTAPSAVARDPFTVGEVKYHCAAEWGCAALLTGMLAALDYAAGDEDDPDRGFCMVNNAYYEDPDDLFRQLGFLALSLAQYFVAIDVPEDAPAIPVVLDYLREHAPCAD